MQNYLFSVDCANHSPRFLFYIAILSTFLTTQRCTSNLNLGFTKPARSPPPIFFVPFSRIIARVFFLGTSTGLDPASLFLLFQDNSIVRLLILGSCRRLPNAASSALYVRSRGIVFRFISVYAPLIYVRLYFTSCPVMLYTFSPRRMKIWPLWFITDSCPENDANECVLFPPHQK